MAVHYKFKSAKDYNSIPTDGPFISVLNLKEKIFESKHLFRGTDFDLVVTNAETNEEYLDEAMLIPRNTSVLIRRVPGWPCMRLVVEPLIQHNLPKMDTIKSNDARPAVSNFLGGADSSGVEYLEDSQWDDFGSDLYAIPEVLPVQASNSIQHAPPPSRDDEDSKIKALIHTPALDWQCQTSNDFGLGRGFRRGMGGGMTGGRGFGQGGLDWKTPPQGYVCHRCKVAGHFIQHCPTNGDRDYDIKRVKPPTGIPKSMLMETSEGSYALPSGAVSILKPNEDAFEKEMEGLRSTRSVGDLPPELHCPLCKEVMKDAVLTSKCCFNSFCDTCVRDHFILKSVCVCGATNVLADGLLPNMTVRDTINRILESNNSSAENAATASQVQDVEFKIPKPKFPSPTSSAASKGEQAPPLQGEEISRVHRSGDQGNVVHAPQSTLEKGKTRKVAYACGGPHDSMSVNEPPSQGGVPVAEEKVQRKSTSAEAGKKKKKNKDRLPLKEIQLNEAGNYMMPLGSSSYNPYWSGMQAGIDGYVARYCGPLHYMGYGLGPLDVPFGVFLPQDPVGAQGHMMHPVPRQMDPANFIMALNARPPMMGREEFEGRKADLRRKHDTESQGGRGLSRDQEFSREAGSSGNASLWKSNYKSHSQSSIADYHRTSNSCRRPQTQIPSVESLSVDHRLQQPQSSSKRKLDRDYDYNHRGHRASVNGYDEYNKTPPSPKKAMSVSIRKGAASAADYTSSDDDDDDRHFKRRRSRYDRGSSINHREY